MTRGQRQREVCGGGGEQRETRRDDDARGERQHEEEEEGERDREAKGGKQQRRHDTECQRYGENNNKRTEHTRFSCVKQGREREREGGGRTNETDQQTGGTQREQGGARRGVCSLRQDRTGGRAWKRQLSPQLQLQLQDVNIRRIPNTKQWDTGNERRRTADVSDAQ